MFAFLSAPLTCLVSHRADHMLCSLGANNIGFKGATALAGILKETQISDLECAATPSVFAFVSAPVDTHPSLAVWPATSSAASTAGGTAPTPRRASPSCASGSRRAL